MPLFKGAVLQNINIYMWFFFFFGLFFLPCILFLKYANDFHNVWCTIDSDITYEACTNEKWNLVTSKLMEFILINFIVVR